MKVCGVVSIAILLGCIAFIDANPFVPFQPMYYQPMYYGRTQYIPQDDWSMFIPESQKSEPSAFRRVLLLLDDITAAHSLMSPDTLRSLSGASQLYASYSGEPEAVPLRGLAAALDVMDLSSSNPLLAILAASGLYLTFTKS